MRRPIILGLIIVVLAAGALFWWSKRGSDEESATPSPSPSVSSTPTPSAVLRASRLFTVTATDSGVSPKEITILSGDSVRFVNRRAAPYWPASDPHPTHTLCAGFDAKTPLAPGDTYELRFSDSGKTCTYHDHLNPADAAFRGRIVVQ